MAKTQTKAKGVDLPKFRYLDDIMRFVDDLAVEVDELTKFSKKQSQLLAFLKSPGRKIKAALVKAADFTFDIDTSDVSTKGLKRKLDPTLMKVVVPNMERLKKRYALAEEFYEKHRELESVESTLITQFRNRSEGPAFNEALQSVRKLKAKVADALKEVLGELNEIAHGHVPDSFEAYMRALEQAVKERVNFETSHLFLYVHVDDQGQLVFTYYMMLEHAVNDEGQITPHLYISVQWVVGDASQVAVSVNHEYELPNKLMKDPGQRVSSVSEAVHAIGHLLDLEDFSTSLGNLPLGPQLKKDPTADLFSYKEYVSKIKISGDTMTFTMKPGIDSKLLREIAYQLYQEVKRMLRVPKGAKLKMEIKPTHIAFNLASVAAPGQVNTYQAEWIKDQFGLNDTQLRKIVNIINQAKDQ